MITFEQCEKAVKEKGDLFAIKSHCESEDFSPRAFISKAKHPQFEKWWCDTTIFGECFGEEYKIDDVFATEKEAKEEAKSRMINQLAELNKEKAK